MSTSKLPEYGPHANGVFAPNRKHGAKGLIALSAEKWPEPVRRMYDERMAVLLNFEHVDPDRDIGACAQIARLETILARIYGWLAQENIIRRDGEPQRVLKTLGTFENILSRLYGRMGFSAESRKSLGAMDVRNDWARLLSGEIAETEGGDTDGD